MPSNESETLADLGDLEIYIPEECDIQSLKEVTCISPVSVQRKGTALKTHSTEDLSLLLMSQPELPIAFVSSNLAAYTEIKRIKLAQVFSGGAPRSLLEKGFKPPTQQDCIIIHHEKIYLMIRNRKKTQTCGSAKQALDPCVNPLSANDDETKELCDEDQPETNHSSPNNNFSRNLNGVDQTHEESLSRSVDCTSTEGETFETQQEAVNTGIQHQSDTQASLIAQKFAITELLEKEKISKIKSKMKARQAQNS